MDIGAFIIDLVIEKIWLSIFIQLLLLHSCQRKKQFAGRCAVGMLSTLAIALLLELAFARVSAPSLQMLWIEYELLVWPLIIALYMRPLFQCRWNVILFSAVAGLCAQETMFGLWALVLIKIPGADTAFWKLVVCSAIGVLLCVGLYFFLAKKISSRSLQALHRRSWIPMAVLYVMSALLIKLSSSSAVFLILFYDFIREFLPESLLERARLSSIYTNILGNFFILFSLRSMLRHSDAEQERELLTQIREEDRKQYNRFRSNVDYINAKAHDLKYYLELFQKGDGIPQKELKRVSERLSELDTDIDSGNETLDMIITERRLNCLNQKIDLIFQTDGSEMEQLDIIDIYTIFCNILDNATEYVAKLPPEDRRIRLGVRTVEKMIFIHQENPLLSGLVIKDGLPVTTKENPLLHGFGLKSVQDTAEKYGGKLVIHTENGIFQLDIYIPLH